MIEDIGTASLIVQITGLLLVVIYSCRRRNLKSSVKAAILIMWAANIFGQIIIAGGGPAAFVGFFILPIYGILLAWLSVTIANKISHKK